MATQSVTEMLEEMKAEARAKALYEAANLAEAHAETYPYESPRCDALTKIAAAIRARAEGERTP